LGVLEELSFRVFGYSKGAWFWVPNDESTHPATGRTWSALPGRHPFVLLSDYTGGPALAVRPRSTTSKSGLAHSAHPPRHVSTCKIEKDGWILRVLWSLGAHAVSAKNYSCLEPDVVVVSALTR